VLGSVGGSHADLQSVLEPPVGLDHAVALWVVCGGGVVVTLQRHAHSVEVNCAPWSDMR